MKKILLILNIFIYLCNANNIKNDQDFSNINYLDKNFRVTLNWLKDKPKSWNKDFFILQFLKQDSTTSLEAKKAYKMAQRKNSRIKKIYNINFNKTNLELNKKCSLMPIKKILDGNEKCLNLSLILNKAVEIPKKDLKIYIKKMKNHNNLKKILQILTSNNILKNLETNNDIENFYKLYFNLSYKNRILLFNKTLTTSFLKKLAFHKKFKIFIKHIIYDKKNQENLQKSLLRPINNLKINSSTYFLLGINAINYNKEKLAYDFFLNSYNSAYFKKDEDKALFWLYKIKKNKFFLHQILNSWSLNIYSLYIKELFNFKPKNIHFNIKTSNKNSLYDIYDQFLWNNILNNLNKEKFKKPVQKYEKIFTDNKTLPFLAFIKEKCSNYKEYYFITPYENILKNYSLKEKIITYSIAKQESNFIPCSISRSTAQGVMQIMPFLSKHIANSLKEEYNIYNQFKPDVNIKYGVYHLKKLNKLYDGNPLFVAYAYNGGMGYLKKQFKKGLFKKSGHNKYEPFLSMEMISYAETREYGKKVLANYYIYNNWLNKKNKLKLSLFFKNLESPKKIKF